MAGSLALSPRCVFFEDVTCEGDCDTKKNPAPWGNQGDFLEEAIFRLMLKQEWELAC